MESKEKQDTIHILVTVDRNYIRPLETMLKSLEISNTREEFHLWLLHSGIDAVYLDGLSRYCAALGMGFDAVWADTAVFQDAPTSKRYPREMYYRLLAPRFLPESLERVLYLDPDILVINPVRPLWETDLEGCTFAAASHSIVLEMVDEVNRRRLGTDTDYFNTGVILMDLAAARRLVHTEDIFRHVREHHAELLLPDQDVFNSLYGDRTKPVPDTIWNYDARRFAAYQLQSSGAHTLDWVLEHTAILHFCGTRKPWKPSHTSRFSALYKHYMQLTQRELDALDPQP